MKPPPFQLLRPSALEEAVEALAGLDAVALAGGQTLMVELNMQRRAPSALVDLSGLEELREVTRVGDQVLIGAMVTQEELIENQALSGSVPLLALASGWVGHPQVRARGTLGGSLALAHPAAELPAAAVALSATLVLQGPNGRRELSAEEFYGQGNGRIAPGEVLVHSLWPVAASARQVSVQEMRHGHGAPSALVGVAAMREELETLSVSVFGATERITRLHVLERGDTAGMDAVDRHELVGQVVDQLPDVVDSRAAPRSYRSRVLKALLVKSLEELDSGGARPLFPRVRMGVTS